MAMRYGLNVDRAAMAGLLHDCAKYMTDDELIEKCTKVWNRMLRDGT